jgi:ATP-dependent DNA ligase
MWVKGQSGNPGGRSKESQEVRRLAKEKTPEALATIIALMTGAEKEGTRLEAAKTVLKLAGVSFDSEELTEALAAAKMPTTKPQALAAVSRPDLPLN